MGRSKIRTPEYWKQYWKDSALKNKEKRNSQNTNLQPEVQLWLDILKSTCEDWINYKNSPTLDNFKAIKDIDLWAFKDSFAINRISEALYLAFKIEPDTFKSKFRKWLERERYFSNTSFTTFQSDVPFESVTEELIWHDIHSESTGNN